MCRDLLILSLLWKGIPGGSVVKILPAMQEMGVQFLGQEDPVEEGVATHSSILAWEIPWTEESGGLQSMGSQELDMTEQLTYTQITTTTPVENPSG